MTWSDADTVAEIERLRVENAKLRAALEELKHELIIHGYAPEGFYIELINAALNEQKP